MQNFNLNTKYPRISKAKHPGALALHYLIQITQIKRKMTYLRDIALVFFPDILRIIKRALPRHKAFIRIERKSDNAVRRRKTCILNFEVWTWTWTWFEWVSWRARQWGMLTNLHNYQHGKIWLSFAVHGNLLPDSTEWGVSLEFHHRRLRIFSIFFFRLSQKRIAN